MKNYINNINILLSEKYDNFVSKPLIKKLTAHFLLIFIIFSLIIMILGLYFFVKDDILIFFNI